MGSAETKKLEKKGGNGKYIYACPKNCFTSYRVDIKYSVRNLVCRKCESKLVRRQPDISKENENDSDTPSIPLLDKNDPQKLVAIGRDDDSSESESETASPPSDFDKTAREEAEATKENYDPSAPKEEDVASQLQRSPNQLYPKVSDVDKEVKFQEYMDNQDEQKAKGAIRKNNPPGTTENHAQLPSMKDDRLDRFLFDIDKGHESDNDDTDDEGQEKRPLTPLQEAMANNMYKFEDDINLIDDQIKVSQAIIELLPNGDEKAKELAIMRDLLGQKRDANRKQREQSGEIARLASTHQIEAAKIGRKQSRHNDALRHIGTKGANKSKKSARKVSVGSMDHKKIKSAGKGSDSSSSSSTSSEDEASHRATTGDARKTEDKVSGQGRNSQQTQKNQASSQNKQRPKESHLGSNCGQADGPPNPSSSSSSSGEETDEGNPNKDKKSDKDPRPRKGSDVTSATSIFELSMIGTIIEELKEARDLGNKVLNDHPDSKTMTDGAKKQIDTTIKDTKKAIPELKRSEEWGQTTPAERDQVEELICEIKTLSIKLFENLSVIHENEEARRLQPKGSLPIWYGDAATFYDWAERIEQAVRFKSEGQKMTDLIACIKGPESTDITKIFKHERTFKASMKKLNLFYEDITTLIPGEEAKIRKLKDFPTSPAEENASILKIIEFYNLLEARQRLDLFSVSFYNECMTKLSSFNSKYYSKYSKKHIKKMSKFIKHLEEILEENGKSLGAKGLSRFKSETSRRPPPPKWDNQGKENRTGIMNAGAEEEGEGNGQKGPYKCGVCNDSHQTYQCPTLRVADTDQCKNILSSKDLCTRCLRPKDRNGCKDKCNNFNFKKFTRCPEPCSTGLNKSICCKRPDLAPQGRDAPSSSTLTAGAMREKQVTILNSVPIGGSASLVETIQCLVDGVGPVNVGLHYDPGAQSTIISSSLRPFVKGFKKGVFWIDTVNGPKRVEAGSGHIVIDSVNGPLSIFGIVKELPNPFANSHRIQIPHLWQTVYKVPSEYALNNYLYQIILGNDALNLHPKEVVSHNGLVLSESRLTKKPLISGYNKDQSVQPGFSGQNITSIMKSAVREPIEDDIAHPIFSSTLSQIDTQLIARLTPDQDFVSKRLCSECREREHCVKCRLDLNCLSKEQSHETKILTDAVTYCAESKRYKYSGIYKENITAVPSYYEETKIRMEKLIKKLKRDPNGTSIAAEMDASIKTNIESGVFAWGQDWLTEDPTRADLQACYSPVSYALKREGTTKVRLVHDYSFSHGARPSFNDMQLLGSSGNYKIGHILLLHRAYEDYSVADIKKFYYCVCVTDKSASLQRFLWKPGGILSDEPWQAVIPVRMIFGRRDAQCVCQAAKLKCAEKFLYDDEEALNWVRKSYTDDVCCASNDGRLAMEKLQRKIENALGNGSFRFKPWVNSKSFDKGEIEKIMSPSNLASSHLGIKWLPQSDEWAVSFILNLECRKRGIKPPEFDLTTHEQVSDYVKSHGLTKRQALAICHILWDPLSLYLPNITNGKILYRNLITSQPLLQWTDNIASPALAQWEKYLHQLIDIMNIKVPRCGLPEGWRDGLSLCLSTDGSQSCSVGRAFLRCDNADSSGVHRTSYLCGISKLAEKGVDSAIKTECNALLITCRMAEQIVVTFGGEPRIKFTDIFICTDSKALLSIVQMDPSRMKLWFITRVSEINHLLTSLKIKLIFAKSEFCDADEASKLNLEENFTLAPTYWTSKFFFKPRSEWPVEVASETDPELNEQITAQVSNTKLHIMSIKVVEDGIINKLLSKFNNFEKVSKTLAYLKCFLNTKDFATNKFEAQNLLLDLAQPTESQIEGLKKKFVVTHVDTDLPGAVLVSREFVTDNQTKRFKYRAVNGNTQVGRTLVNSLHQHVMSQDREHALALEKGFYIIGGRQLFRKLTKKCITCRKIRSHTIHPPAGQSLLLAATKGNRYQTVTIDVFGFLRAKVGRSIVKVYLLTTSCHKTLHVTFSVMLDNSAASLMSAFQRTLHNVASTCRVCVSDSGTNIITIKDLGLNGDNEEIQINDVAAGMQAAGITFRTSTSSPWRSTRAEKAHHLLKLALRRSGLAKHHSYTIEQWFHIASHMTRVLNDRPLTLTTIGNQLTTITPNKLIYGNTIGHLNIDFSPRAKLYDSLIQLEKDLEAWQNVFLNTYVKDQLNYLEKIQGTDAALEPGSVVMIKDHLNPTTKFPALGTVSRVQSDRTYVVEYVKREAETKSEAGRLIVTQPALLSELQRPAQRLVFLFHPDKETDFNPEITLDPILGQQEDVVDDVIPEPAKPTKPIRPSMKFIADDDAMSTIVDRVKPKNKNKK